MLQDGHSLKEKSLGCFVTPTEAWNVAQYQILGYGYKLPPYLNPNRNVVFGFLLVALCG